MEEKSCAITLKHNGIDSKSMDNIRKSIQEWTKWNLWDSLWRGIVLIAFKNLKGYDLLLADHTPSTKFTWSILEYFVTYANEFISKVSTYKYSKESFWSTAGLSSKMISMLRFHAYTCSLALPKAWFAFLIFLN